MFGMSTDVAMSMLRHILTFIGGIVVAKGWISADQASELAGGVVGIAGVLYAVLFHAQSNGAIPTLSTNSNLVPNVANSTSGA